MKKSFYALSISLLIFLMAACGNKTPDVASSGSAQVTSSTSAADPNGPVVVTWSQAVWAASVQSSTFFLTTGSAQADTAAKDYDTSSCNVNNAIEGSIAISSDNLTTSFTPTNTLQGNTTYYVCLTSGIQFASMEKFAGNTIVIITAAVPTEDITAAEDIAADEEAGPVSDDVTSDDVASEDSEETDE